MREHSAAIIAFGSGHSHFEDRSHFESIQEAVADCTVVLLLPDVDQILSLTTLRARCLDTKGHDWNRDDHDYLAEWATSEQNQLLADVVVYSDDLTPERYAEKIESALRDFDRSAEASTARSHGEVLSLRTRMVLCDNTSVRTADRLVRHVLELGA
ncbi:MAG: hypothetical protein QOH53_404 [Ilumatobacteraceae bacterium]